MKNKMFVARSILTLLLTVIAILLFFDKAWIFILGAIFGVIISIIDDVIEFILRITDNK